jgi:DNA-binding transcriptional LysR family regulator
MELHQVRYFLALARSLNFTRAAEQCNVTQPALTKAVQRLEQELGGALIYRERELTQLTDLGKLILPMVERTLSAADAVRLHAREFQRMGIAPLKIGLAPCISVTLVIQPLIEIGRVIPGLQVELIEVPAERLPVLLLEGEVNVALAGNIEGLPDRIDHWLLFEERFVILTAAEDPLASLGQIPIDALAETAWVERIGCEVARRFWQSHFPGGEEPKIGYRGRQESHLQHMVAAGLGVMLAPEHAPHLPTLVAREIAGDPLRREVQLLVVAGRRYSPALDAFVKIARLRDWRGDLHDARPRFAEMDRETRSPQRLSCLGRPAHAEISRCA